jgi:hypothetical protein
VDSSDEEDEEEVERTETEADKDPPPPARDPLEVRRQISITIHCKKRLAMLPSPAGMSLALPYTVKKG